MLGRNMKDKNGCIMKRYTEYPYNEIPVANTHTITAHDIVQPDGTIRRVYKPHVPTLKLGDEDDKV